MCVCVCFNEHAGIYALNNGMLCVITVILDFVQLPSNVCELNDYMCGHMNRKGIVCSECVDGFGPYVTSFGYKCANCSKPWSGVALYF